MTKLCVAPQAAAAHANRLRSHLWGIGRVTAIIGRGLVAGIALCACAPAAAQTPSAPAPVNLPSPVLGGLLTTDHPPPTLDAGAFGHITVDGLLSGLGLVQSNPAAGDRDAAADIGSAQIFAQKTDGLVQFYVQAGAYAIPDLGVAYRHHTDAGSTWGTYFDALPEAYLKLAPTANFSIAAGKLPTLVGPESTFDFENYNIERGLLWNQTQSVSRGVQANLTAGPVLINLSLNDGYYSDRFNWISTALTWTIDSANTLELDSAANLGRTAANTLATPLAQNNSEIYDLVYTYKSGKLVLQPYLQYNHAARNPAIGIAQDIASYGGAVIADYTFTKRLSLAARAEYIATTGRPSPLLVANFLYGLGSGAFSFTLTPTFVYKQYFVRAEAAVVQITSLTAGSGFGQDGRSASQIRGVLQAGIVF